MPSTSDDLAYSLDPVLWAKEVLDFRPDPWQAKALQSSGRQAIWNIHRQAGKSSVAAIKALHKAVFAPGSLTLVVSPSERQSSELYRKFLAYYDKLDSPPGMPEDKALSCTLSTGSRVVALPGKEATVRSFSAVSLIIEDEASRVDDALNAAIRPMLAISHGELLLMSTPHGKRGHFFEAWENGGPNWERILVTADQCPRITPEFLADERRALGDWMYRQEYFGEFVETVDQLFHYDDVVGAISADVKALDIGVDKPW